MRAFQARNWFQNLTGIHEEKWDFDMASLPENKKVLSACGKFEAVSILELERRCQALGLKKIEGRALPEFVLRVRQDRNAREDLFDTSALQVRSKPGTLFQVASNFNCQECGSVLSNPFKPKYIRGLMSDATQGPAAAAGAGAGAVLRLSLHRERRIDLLEGTGLEAPNGKLFWENAQKQKNFEPREIKIGLHTGVQAAFDRSAHDSTYLHYPKGPRIDQVYTSTIALDDDENDLTDEQLEMTRTLLVQAYRGTYLAAALRKAPALVLTLIGGGAFGNPVGLILDVIGQVHRELGPLLAKGATVTLPVYGACTERFIEMAQASLAFDQDLDVLRVDLISP